MIRLFVLISIIFLFSCKNEDNNKLTSENYVDLYHRCDSLIRSNDTVIIFNSKFDTIIIETGVFAYMQYDYPLSIPYDLIRLGKEAIQYEGEGKHTEAQKRYRKIIKYYNTTRKKQNNNFTCTNDYLRFNVNSSILCSFAYDKLGFLDESIEVLNPYLANVESWKSKIHDLFIEQSIKKHGIEKVIDELKSCPTTIHKKEKARISYEDWVINIFDAEIGIGTSCNYDTITAMDAENALLKYDFYTDLIGKQHKYNMQ